MVGAIETRKKTLKITIEIHYDQPRSFTRDAETPHGVKSDYFRVSVLEIAVLKRILNSLRVYVVPNPR